MAQICRDSYSQSKDENKKYTRFLMQLDARHNKLIAGCNAEWLSWHLVTFDWVAWKKVLFVAPLLKLQCATSTFFVGVRLVVSSTLFTQMIKLPWSLIEWHLWSLFSVEDDKPPIYCIVFMVVDLVPNNVICRILGCVIIFVSWCFLLL